MENAKILEGDEEEKYWKDFVAWLNNRKRMQFEERVSKRQRSGGRGGGRGGGWRRKR